MKTFSIEEQYILLAHVADSLIGKGTIIDAFYGDKDIVKDIPKLDINELINRLKKLHDDIKTNLDDEQPYYKQTFLLKQVNALLTQAQVYSGAKIQYREILKSYLDFEVGDPNWEAIDILKENINKELVLLGYKGSLNKMVSDWKIDSSLSSAEYLKSVKILAKKYSEKTYEILKISNILSDDDVAVLKEFDQINFELKETNESWAAYNYYDRNYSGTVVFNKNGNFHKHNLKTFVSHEAYPGHHTSNLIREYLVKTKQLGQEATIHLLNTPECTIAEGIGDNAISFIHENNENIDLKIEVMLDDLAAEVDYAAVIKLFEERVTESEIISYLVKDKLLTEEKYAIRSLNFLKSWGYYVPNYKYGREIVRKYYESEGYKIFKLIYGICCPTSLSKNYPNVII